METLIVVWSAHTVVSLMIFLYYLILCLFSSSLCEERMGGKGKERRVSMNLPVPT